MRIATWNVNSLRVRLPHVLDWLGTHDADILALQETKVIDADFPEEAFTELGYHVSFSGQKTYNGVALISRSPIHEVITEAHALDDPQRRILGALIDEVYVLNLYVPNGSAVGSDKYDYKLTWLSAITQTVAELTKKHNKIIILGDFNIAPEDDDVHDPKAWEGSVLVSDAERDALQNLLALGFKDCFRLFPQEEKTYSWWDYRGGGFRRNHGLRIDLILASEALAQSCSICAVDKEPRKLERPSDHAPVVAVFE